MIVSTLRVSSAQSMPDRFGQLSIISFTINIYRNLAACLSGKYYILTLSLFISGEILSISIA